VVKSKAPEITPVSNPNRRPARAAMMLIARIKRKVFDDRFIVVATFYVIKA